MGTGANLIRVVLQIERSVKGLRSTSNVNELNWAERHASAGNLEVLVQAAGWRIFLELQQCETNKILTETG